MFTPTPDQLQRRERFRQAGMVWHRSELGKEQITVTVSFINFDITADKDAHDVQRRYFVAAREQLQRRLLAYITSGHEPPVPVLRIYQPPPPSSSESSSGSEESDVDAEQEKEEGYEACDEMSEEASGTHGIDHNIDDNEDHGFDALRDFTVRMEFVVEETAHEPVEVLRDLVGHVNMIIAEIDSTRQRVWPPHAAGPGLVSARIVKDGLPMQQEEEVDSEWPDDEEEDHYSCSCGSSSGHEEEEEDSEWTEDEASFDEAEEYCPSDSDRFSDDNNDPESADDSEDEENPIIYSDDDVVVPLDGNEDATQARIAWLLQAAMRLNPGLFTF